MGKGRLSDPRGTPQKIAGRHLRASYAQERLWFLEQLDPSEATYNQLNGIRIRGKLDYAVLEKSLRGIISRHRVLSSCLKIADGKLIQAPSVHEFKLTFTDLTPLPSEARLREAEAQALREVKDPFVLSEGPMIRARLFRLDEMDRILAVFTHHTAFDGWSFQILLRELPMHYSLNSGSTSSPLPPLPWGYTDYASWQRSSEEGGLFAAQYEYWRQMLSGALPMLDLPTDYPRSKVLNSKAGIQSILIKPELQESIKDLGRRQGMTMFMVLLAAFSVLLGHYSSQDDVLVGCPIAGRNRREVEDLIGMFVNTLALRADLSGDPTVMELLLKVRKTALGAFSNQDVPFDRLVEELHPSRDPSRNPICQAAFQLRNYPVTALESGSLKLEPYNFPYATAKFDLTLDAAETEDGLLCHFVYPSQLFEASTIQRMAWHWNNLLEAMVRSPHMNISELPMLDAEERQELLEEWNATGSDYPRESTVHQLFEEIARGCPSSIAVVHGYREMSYAQLNGRANQLAAFLRSEGLDKGGMVGVCMERSPEMLVCFLAILKAGGAYVPIDPSDPRDRIAFVTEDSKARMILTMERFKERLPDGAPTMLCYDLLREDLDRHEGVNAPSTVGPTDPAYVIYTSGSTGRPKGVCIPHRAINRLVIKTNYVQIGPGDVIAHQSNPAFDMATSEIWGALLNGAKLVIVEKTDLLSPKDFVALLRREGVTILNLTTPLFNLMAREDPASFSSVKTLIFGGDVADPVAVRQVLSNRPPQRLINCYGPTENTTYSTFYLIKDLPGETEPIPIGIPVSNTKAYVLDRRLQLVPVGLTGELYLGGDGLALGYHGMPELTKAAFIDNPFEPGSKLYKTGDLARYRDDGNILFLGRGDLQVKIRGFRVELGEVESVLRTHPSVGDCTVTASTGPVGRDQWLSAYVVPKGVGAANDLELRDYLRARLPEYMVPSAFVFLGELPHTPAGKVDRRRLPAPQRTAQIDPGAAAKPTDALEARLKAIWEDALGRGPIGVDDGFFEVGGHSLAAVHVFARMEEALGVKLPFSALLQAQTVREMARFLRTLGNGPSRLWSPLVPLQTSGSGVPLFLIHAADGDLLNYTQLIRSLGTARPLYGLQTRGLDGKSPPYASIEEMASDYIRAIRTVQPEGPYFLLGFSSGGVTAFEMALQLAGGGNCSNPGIGTRSEVGRLMILDTPAPTWEESQQFASRRAFLNNLLSIPSNLLITVQRRIVRKTLRDLPSRVTRHALTALQAMGFRGTLAEPALPLWVSNLPEDRRPIVLALMRALGNYRPRKYAGRIVLFKPRWFPLLHPGDQSMGWGMLASKGVECVTIGNQMHGNMLQPPNSEKLAWEIKRRVEGVRQDSNIKPAGAAAG